MKRKNCSGVFILSLLSVFFCACVSADNKINSAASAERSTLTASATPTPTPTGKIIHVDSSYSGGSEDGEPKTPYKTINKALENARPYDKIIVKKGKGYEIKNTDSEINIDIEGLSLTGEDGTKPSVKRSGFDENESAVIQISASNVTVKNLHLSGKPGWEKSKEDCSQSGPAGFAIIRYIGSEDPPISNIHIEENLIDDIGHDYKRCRAIYKAAGIEEKDYPSMQAHGILVNGGNASTIGQIHILRNVLQNLKLGNSEAITIKNNVREFYVNYNTISDVDNIGIDIVGYEDNLQYAATGGQVQYNTITNLLPGNSAYPWVAGVYIDGGQKTDVSYNTIEKYGFGIEIASEKCDVTVKDIIVKENTLRNNLVSAIGIGHSLSYKGPNDEEENNVEDQRSLVDHCEILSNKIYTASPKENGGSIRLISHSEYSLKNILIKGNYINAQNSEYLVWWDNSTWNIKECLCQDSDDNKCYYPDKLEKFASANKPDVRFVDNIFSSKNINMAFYSDNKGAIEGLDPAVFNNILQRDFFTEFATNKFEPAK